MSETPKLRVAFVLNENGEIDTIASDAPCEVYIVCPHVPRDRVYLYQQDVGPEHIRKHLGGYAVGHLHDGTIDLGEPVSPRLPPIKTALTVVKS